MSGNKVALQPLKSFWGMKKTSEPGHLVSQETGEAFYCPIYWGKSPIHLSVFARDLDKCEELLTTAGECVNAVYSGTTPLHVACRLHRQEFVKTFIKHNCDINALTVEGKHAVERL